MTNLLLKKINLGPTHWAILGGQGTGIKTSTISFFRFPLYVIWDLFLATIASICQFILIPATSKHLLFDINVPIKGPGRHIEPLTNP